MTRRHAFRVDALLGQRNVVVKDLGRLLPRLALLAGASLEPDGSILLVLDVSGPGRPGQVGPLGQPGQVLVLDGGGTSIGLLVDEVVGIERVQEAGGAPLPGQRSPLVAAVLPGARPLLLLDVASLSGWLAL
jgi:CheW-like domain